MRDWMGSLDLAAAITELRDIESGYIQKIYQFGDHLRLDLRSRGSRYQLLIQPGSRIHLTRYSLHSPNPTAFAMFLRKHLESWRIASISQLGFDRIVDIHLERAGESKHLIAELIPRGNLVLTSQDYKIIQPMRRFHSKNRQLSPGIQYLPPPSSPNPLELDPDGLLKLWAENPGPIAKLLAKLNLGSIYALELCSISGVSPEICNPDPELASRIIQGMRKMISPILNRKLKPMIVLDSQGRYVDVIPFQLEHYSSNPKLEFESFNHALDEYFTQIQISRFSFQDELKDILRKQIQAYSQLRKQITQLRSKAELLYQHYHHMISRGISRLEIDGLILEIDPTKDVHWNARRYYERAKKLESKLPKLKQLIKQNASRLKQPREEIIQQLLSRYPQLRPRIKPRWYDEFRWCFTSEGLLVVAGRDAQSNQKLIRNHLEKGDLVLHADLPGAVAILKSGENSSSLSIHQAAGFACCFSKYWSLGLSRARCLVASWDQISRSVPSGHYLPKGGILIQGEKKFIDADLDLGIGLEIGDETRLIIGPPEVIASRARYWVKLSPGDMERSQAAAQIHRYFLNSAGMDEKLIVKSIASPAQILKLLPQGGFKLWNC